MRKQKKIIKNYMGQEKKRRKRDREREKQRMCKRGREGNVFEKWRRINEKRVGERMRRERKSDENGKDKCRN